MEDIEKDEYVIEYVGKIKYKRMERNDVMKIDRINLWINGSENGGLPQYINHLCDPNCELVQWGVDGLPRMCFFAKKKINSRIEVTFDYNWELVSGQDVTVCLWGSYNCDGQIETKKDVAQK